MSLIFRCRWFAVFQGLLTLSSQYPSSHPGPILWEPHLQHAKGALIAHADQAAESELQDHGALKGDKIPYVLQEEVPGPVVVTVAVQGRRDPKNYHTDQDKGRPTLPKAIPEWLTFGCGEVAPPNF